MNNSKAFLAAACIPLAILLGVCVYHLSTENKIIVHSADQKPENSEMIYSHMDQAKKNAKEITKLIYGYVSARSYIESRQLYARANILSIYVDVEKKHQS